MAITGHYTEEGEPDVEHDYAELFEKMNGEPYADKKEELETVGPIVNVMRKSKGVRVTGAGIAGEVADQVAEMNKNIDADEEKEAEKEAEEAAEKEELSLIHI